jgi:hypothetical protein
MALNYDEAVRARQLLKSLRRSNERADRATDLLRACGAEMPSHGTSPSPQDAPRQPMLRAYERIERLAREIIACFDQARSETAHNEMDLLVAAAGSLRAAEEEAIAAERPWAFARTPRGRWHIYAGDAATAALEAPVGGASDLTTLCGVTSKPFGGWSLVWSFDGGYPSNGVCKHCAQRGNFPPGVYRDLSLE